MSTSVDVISEAIEEAYAYKSAESTRATRLAALRWLVARAEAAEAQLSDMELRFKVASFDSKLWERIEVAESGCWEWRGYRGPHGYGQVSLGSAHLRAHRATYEAVHGPIPEAAEAEVARLTRSGEWAVTIISNVGEGEWKYQTKDWREAARQWLDDFHSFAALAAEETT